jgi:hypothetical protein
MGETAKKKCAAEAKAARKAKKDAEQATQPVEGPPASVDPILSGNKPPNSSDSKYSKKSKAVPQEKMPRACQSISTCHSTRSRSTLAAVSSGSGEQRGSNATHPRRLATAAAETLLQQVRLVEDSDFEEHLDGNSDSKEEIELDDNEDGTMIGGDNRSLVRQLQRHSEASPEYWLCPAVHKRKCQRYKSLRRNLAMKNLVRLFAELDLGSEH